MYLQMPPRRVVSSRPLTILAEIRSTSFTKVVVMIGVLITFVALMISLILGTPRVMFMEATPAKWNVFSVI